jgi:hypothetical protein
MDKQRVSITITTTTTKKKTASTEKPPVDFKNLKRKQDSIANYVRPIVLDESTAQRPVKRARISSKLDGDRVPIFTEEHRKTLESEGAVIVEDAIPLETCKELHEEMLEFHKRWNPALDPRSAEGWKYKDKPPGQHGLNQFRGHETFSWAVRQHPRVVQIFADYYGAEKEDLVTSFDGFRFHVKTNKGRDAESWAHVDVGGAASRGLPFRSLQASVAITSSEHPDDGDFVYWRKSHRVHEHYFKARPQLEEKKGHFFKIDQNFLREIEKDGRPHLSPKDELYESPDPLPMERVELRRPAGSMVLWYSETVHESRCPKHYKSVKTGSKTEEERHDAAAVFVCMAPRKFAKPGELKKRIEAFEERRATPHWPVRYFSTFPKTPRLRGEEAYRSYEEGVKNLGTPDVKLTPLGRRLVGYEK